MRDLVCQISPHDVCLTLNRVLPGAFNRVLQTLQGRGRAHVTKRSPVSESLYLNLRLYKNFMVIQDSYPKLLLGTLEVFMKVGSICLQMGSLCCT